jgi:hypothetical protein
VDRGGNEEPMTSEEIAKLPMIELDQIFWLKEIAYQLAIHNERGTYRDLSDGQKLQLKGFNTPAGAQEGQTR